MSIPYLKIYELSVANYLKYEVLPKQFLEQEQNVALIYDASLDGYVSQSNMIPSPVSAGRGWAFFDELSISGNVVIDTTAEQTSRVSVIGASTYDIDYNNGIIYNPDSTPTAVSYYWNYVSFILGWPGTDPPPLPVVALDVDESVRQGIQLGGGSNDILSCSLYVFATSEIEKLEIIGQLYDALYNRTLTIQDWHEGSYLNFDGTFNTSFTPTPVSGLGHGFFSNVISSSSGPRVGWSEVNRHRGKITFDLEVLRD